MEILDVYDEEFNVLVPSTATIDVVHQKGLWHQTFACWLINPRKNTILLQLRGPKNRIGPNTFDASASGHLSAGEKPEEGFRELREELGINIDINDKIYLGINRNVVIKDTYINHEFCHIFMAKTTNSLENFQLQDGEVSGIFELNIQDGIQLFSDKAESVKIKGRVWNGTMYVIENRTINKTDFCSHKDRTLISGYYLKVMIMAERYLKNYFPYRI